jgi:tetratricopeptide (TPR) repeat protein
MSSEMTIMETTNNAKVLQERGIKLYQQKEYEEARRTFQMALEIYQDEGKQALDVMSEALNIFQELGDPLRTAQVMGNLGGVYMELGDKEQAYQCYRQAADVFQELGEKKMLGDTLIAMGSLQVKDGKLWNGAATYEAGLEQLDNLSATQKVMKNLIGFRNRLIGGSK